MLTLQQIGETLGCSRQMAAVHVKKGCPRTAPEDVREWYASNVRFKSDRRRPTVARRQMIGPNFGSRILDLMQDVDAALELDEDLRALPGQIASDPNFFPAVEFNAVIRHHVEQLRHKWFDAVP